MIDLDKAKPFYNRYCPECLAPVNADRGDHWKPCEYEAKYRDWVNPIQPLTELQKLTRELSDCNKAISFHECVKALLKAKIDKINSTA